MIEIDGMEKSGSGTLVRFAVALSAITGEPLHIFRIRTKREKPGLRPQHLQTVRACAQLCSGSLEGDSVGSLEVVLRPGDRIEGGAFEWDIGTAGSATMMAFTLIPLALFAKRPSRFKIKGGLFQDFAPTAFYMQKILLPHLAKMGVQASLEIIRPGYVPKGSGEILLSVEPKASALQRFEAVETGRVRLVRGLALASHLERGGVARRMADQCRRILLEGGYATEIVEILDESAVQPGAALLLHAETDTGCLIGSDMAGKRGRRSEDIADKTVKNLLEDLSAGATVDRYAADQLILFAGIAAGETRYLAPGFTDHMDSNLWLIQKILGAGVTQDGKRISIDGTGFFSR